jgi:DNA end-binding protein Ku
VCTLDNEVVPWEDVGRAYEVRKGEYVVFNKEELASLRPESNKKINIDKFVQFESVDRIFFEKSYILVPDNSEDSYGLMLEAFKQKNMAGVGRFTLRTKEYPVLIYPYRDSLVLTTLRYSNEIVDPKAVNELKNVKTPDNEELELAKKIIDNLSGEFDITEYHDTFTEQVEKLVEQKIEGETIIIEESKQEEVKELMAALQETLAQLQQT